MAADLAQRNLVSALISTQSHNMPRHYLTNKQRTAIQHEIKKRRSTKELRYDELAEWAREQLKLSFSPSRSVLSRLSTSLLETGDIPKNNAKRSGQPANEALEHQLLQWINAQNISGRCLTGDIIRAKAIRLLEEVNALLPEDSKVIFKFSSGWLWRFQKRWNLKSRKLHGEAKDADEQAVERELPELRAACSRYAKEDIWNADETGLNYAMPPDQTISQTALPGRKKDKKRLTLLVCSNATGSEKFPLLFIGKANKPRCFNKKSGAELGFDYFFNKNAWMTMVIFFDWLKRFDAFIARTPGRRVLLLLDNFCGHGSPDCLPELCSVEVKFLPANTTSRLQPMDAGIIASLKRRYRTLQYNRVLDALDSDDDIYKIDQLTAMRYVQSVWHAMPIDIIVNCWSVCGLLDSTRMESENRESLVASDITALKSVLSSLPNNERRMSINKLLDADEKDFLEPFDESHLAQNIVQELQGETTGDTDDVEDSARGRGALLSLQEQVRTIQSSILIAECQETLDLQLVHHLRLLLCSLRSQTVSGMRQTTLNEFF